jgi:predicted phosphodiesterase
VTYRQLLAAALWLALCGAPLTADPCRFAVMGDNWARAGATDLITPPASYPRIVKEVNLLQPDFVVFLGDCIRGYSDIATMEHQWQAFEAVTEQLEMPVYLVVGNHDVFSKETEGLYQQRHGRLWYSFDHRDCHFVILDSEDQTAPGRIAGAQLAWLKSDLAAAKGRRSYVFVHQPLWGMKDREFGRSEWGRRVHPLLAASGVDTVFAGHLHQYTLQPTRDGVRYVITGGAGGEQTNGALGGGFLHYLMVTAPAEGRARLAVIRTGNIEPEDVVTAEQAERVTQFARQFRLAPIVAEGRPVTHRVSLRLTNPFATAITGAIEFYDAAGWTTPPRSCEFALPGNGATDLGFDLGVDPAQTESPLAYCVTYEVERRGSSKIKGEVPLVRSTVARKRRGLTLDGSLEEWIGEPCLRLERKSQVKEGQGVWGGPGSFSALAWVGCDGKRLYFAVKVKDASVVPTPADAASPTGDSVALYLDGRPRRALARREYSPGAGFMVFTPGLGDQPARVLSPRDPARRYAGARVASQPTPDGYAMEIAVPLSSFPGRGDLMGLDLAVKDTSRPEGAVTLFWHGNATDWRDASQFGRLRLE